MFAAAFPLAQTPPTSTTPYGLLQQFYYFPVPPNFSSSQAAQMSGRGDAKVSVASQTNGSPSPSPPPCHADSSSHDAAAVKVEVCLLCAFHAMSLSSLLSPIAIANHR